jgi:2',3'-cyclic-nucleotide 2'-phosphodiesterase / 3'-nucleotidase
VRSTRRCTDTDRPAFSFEGIPGLAYAVDLSQPARFDAHGRMLDPSARRIVGLCMEGQPLDPSRPVILVSNNHRAGLVNALRQERPLPVALAEGSSTHDVLADYVRSSGAVGATPEPEWRFLPMPGTSVTSRGGPGSASHLGDLAPYRPESLGFDSEGFRLYRLHL